MIVRLARRWRLWLGGLAAVVVLPPAALLLTAALTSLPEELGAPAGASVRVTDREGRLLREVRAGDGKRARPLGPEEVGPRLTGAILAAEDRRFWRHHGVDPIALGRAAAQDLRHLRVVSGGSTLTMQLARTLRPRPRTLAGKWREAALALRISWSLDRRRILAEYLNRVDFGPNLRGVGAASQAYFDKAPGALSLAEAALLAGLPRGPSLYALTRRPDLAKRRRDRVLDRMLAAGFADADAVARARAEPVVAQREAAAFGAPHLVQSLVEGQAGGPGASTLETTIDGRLQRAAEAAAIASLGPLAAKHVSAAAVVVIENESGDVLGYVGSPDLHDAARLGHNDGARALRQPGSTLKPFLYALAMERLGFTAATMLPDVELHLALEDGRSWAPRDYDDKLRGPVRLRQALGNSLNVPAVWTAERVGVAALLQRLRELGFDTLTEGPAYYGPALALGDGEVTLFALARAYATLARRGVDRPPRTLRAVTRVGGAREIVAPEPPRRVIPEPYADAITDILKDPRAREASFAEAEALRFDFEVAAKTGTSKGYRDNWAVGFSSEVTVAAWVGNFDGGAMDEVSGVAGAGPLFHAVMAAAMAHRAARPLPIERGFARVAVCPLSGGAPTPACGAHVLEWVPEAGPRDLAPCELHAEILVDRRNGLRAGPACAAAEPRVFERYPPELLAWATAAHRPLAPDAFSPLCPGEDPPRDGDGALHIAYPHDGARFLLDPDRPRALQAVSVLVSTETGTREVTLRVDGAAPVLLRAPFTHLWVMEPGDHTFAAEANGRTATVHVSVR